MDSKKIYSFLHKNVVVKTKKATFTGYYIDDSDKWDNEEFDGILLENNKVWDGNLKLISIAEIESIEVVE
jgi:hypothetical protein